MQIQITGFHLIASLRNLEVLNVLNGRRKFMSVCNQISSRCMPKVFGMIVLVVCMAAGHTGYGSLRRTPIVEAVEKVIPGVVNIGTERMVKVMYDDPFFRMRGHLFDQFFRDFMGTPAPPGYRVGHSLGSGIIVHEDGYLLTNYHVIERASLIMVTLNDGSGYQARVIAADEINDLALIKIDPDQKLSPVSFAEDDDLLLGEPVIVVGNPFGLSHSVTVGVLSAMDRPATYRGKVLFRDILQTDAAVNPGSSGGPLVNIEGNVIGVNVAFDQEAQNIGFALPVKRVRALLAKWLAPSALNKLWMGMQLKLQEGHLVVDAVDQDGPAYTGGLRPGDRLVSVEGTPVTSFYGLNMALVSKALGDVVEFDVIRGGAKTTFRFMLEAIPKPSGTELAAKKLGITFLPKPGSESPFRRGLQIEAIEADSPADKAGVRAGYWITRIGDIHIHETDDVGVALAQYQQGDVVPIMVVNVVDRDSLVVAQSSILQVRVR